MAKIFGSGQRKNPTLQASVGALRDGSVVPPYSAAVRKTEEKTSDSPVLAWEWMYRQYPPSTELGRELRRAIAEMWVRDLDAKEAELREEEKVHAQVSDRLERTMAEQKVRIRCLVELGATPDEFAVLRRVLEEVVVRGHLTIREAAVRAHRLAQRKGDSPDDGESGALSGPSGLR